MTPTFWPGSHHVRHVEVTPRNHQDHPHPYQQPGLGRRPQSGTEVKLAGVQRRGQFGGVETDEKEQSVAKWISMPGRVMLELGFEGRIQAPQVTEAVPGRIPMTAKSFPVTFTWSLSGQGTGSLSQGTMRAEKEHGHPSKTL